MASVLITGMSGVGKSTVLAELTRRGFDTVDTDYGDWIHLVDGEPMWREDRIGGLLSRPRTGPLFILGTVANQGRFYQSFSAVVLLSAPPEVIFKRLSGRATNDFGKSEAERAKIAIDIAEVEPLLRAGATHELDTVKPPTEVADAIVAIATAARDE